MSRLTKAETARIIGRSERAVERFSRPDGDSEARLSVTYERVPGSFHEQPMYETTEVLALASELQGFEISRAPEALGSKVTDQGKLNIIRRELIEIIEDADSKGLEVSHDYLLRVVQDRMSGA